MAEVLSMKEEPKVELTPDEQESLAIGEELEAQQESLLAGKYKNAQELEKAYKELESKLGTPEPAETKSDEPDNTESKKENTEVETAFLESLWEESLEDGDFKQETLDKLKGMNPTDLAQQYLNYRAEVVNKQPTLSQQDVDNIYNIAGGKDGYVDMMKWAKGNIDAKEIEMFDNVVSKNDPLASFFAVKSLHYRYMDSQGVDAPLLTGKAVKAGKPGYQSQAALVAAMSDPRYDTDPAYRSEVMEKLARSDIDF